MMPASSKISQAAAGDAHVHQGIRAATIPAPK